MALHLPPAGGDGVRIWNATTGTLINTFAVGYTGGFTSLVFSPDGTMLAAGSYDENRAFMGCGDSHAPQHTRWTP